MGKIVLLDDLTINQIAAGEVIERPASVVKELVENSIDANAKNIVVEIKNGGISYIRITDDGNGIEKDDMEIAFERHATSKIRNAEDLDEVKSMGFRGEALASIASIANVQMISKTRDEEFGNQITIKGGNILSQNETGAKDGTSITITELFYNTPVRYKFLKKDFTESGYIEETITRIALANPNVSIKLINTGKVVIQTNGTGRLEDVIYSIYGKEIYDNILLADYELDGYHVTGVVGKPIISRSNRANQLFFINKRFVKDKTLTSAAEQGFKGLVTIGKHGFLILNIDMDPKKVDVNVHPTKLEVRFQEESVVFKVVYHAIKETLLKSDLVSDPVKDYSNVTPNDILKGISNKARLEAWSINGNEKKSNSEDFRTTPQFSEFKNTISDLDKETRNNFIDEVTKAKTPEEIMQNLRKYTEMASKIKASNFNNTVDTGKPETNNNTVNTDESKSYVNENVLNSNNSILKEDETEFTKNSTNPKADINRVISDGKALLDKYKWGSEKDTNLIVNDANIEKSKQENTNNLIEKFEDSTANNTIENITKRTNESSSENTEESINESSSENTEEIIDECSNENTEESTDGKAEEISGEKVVTKEATTNEDVTEEKATKDVVTEATTKEATEEEKAPSFEEMYKKLFGRDIATAQKEYAQKQKNSEFTLMEPILENEMSLFEANEEVPPYQFVGIAFKTYIILTMRDELYILDQHAAHERIMYEKVKKNYFSTEQKDSQLMLLPDVINLNNRDMGIYRDNREMFAKAGFIIDEFGENTVKIVGVPSFCLNFNNREIFLETLDGINTVARTAKQEVEDRFLATIACKAAVKAHMALSKEEVDSLMTQLLKLPNPFSCPHGRPTVIKMTKNDIEKKFSRRM